MLEEICTLAEAKAAWWMVRDGDWQCVARVGEVVDLPVLAEGVWVGPRAVSSTADSTGQSCLVLAEPAAGHEWVGQLGVSWLEARQVIDDQRVAAREAEQRYVVLRDLTFEGMAIHRDGVLVEVNQSLAEMYGYSRDEMIGMSLKDLIAPEILGKVADLVKSSFDGAYETTALRKDGSRLALEARGQACVFEGRPARVASFRDLRERKAAEAELEAARRAAERSSQLKTTFLGDMSHEVRTPMTAVLGLAQQLLESDLSGEQRLLMERLQGSAHGLLDLLNDLVDITRIEEGRVLIMEESFDLREALLSAARATRRLASDVELTLSIAAGVQERWVGDRSRIQQVLLNLLDNAAKYTRQGSIAVRVTRGRGGLVFAVHDTGVGMTPTELEGVFERFVQGREGERQPGAGLGLYITRQLVGLLGGHLSATSEVGGGSVFRVELPLVAEPEDYPSVQGRRVLLVGECSSDLERHLECLGAVRVYDASEPWDYGLSTPAAHVPEGWRSSFSVVGTETDVVGWDDRGFAGALTYPLVTGGVARVVAGQCLDLARPGPQVSEAGCEVLLAEDNPELQQIVSELLEAVGHRVTVVGNGALAIRACESRRFDAVLLDVQMPIMDGLTAARTLRNREPPYEGLIVALTAHAMKEHESQCRAAGMDEYLPKPIDMTRLRAILAGLSRSE